MGLLELMYSNGIEGALKNRWLSAIPPLAPMNIHSTTVLFIEEREKLDFHFPVIMAPIGLPVVELEMQVGRLPGSFAT